MAEKRYKLTEEGKETIKALDSSRLSIGAISKLAIRNKQLDDVVVKNALKSLPKTTTSRGFVKRLNKRIDTIERRKHMKTVNSILNWLMPRSFRRYWSNWFIFTYFAIGCCIHCPQVAKAMLWPFVILLPWLRSLS